MKITLLSFYLIVLCLNEAYSQQTTIRKDEIIQVFNYFIKTSYLTEDHLSKNGFIVKILKETNPYEYSIAITTIAYRREVPKTIISCLKIDNLMFFILTEDNILIDVNNTDSMNYDTISSLIILNADSVFSYDYGDEAVVHFPSIDLYKVKKACFLLNSRKVTFQEYYPIKNISKKYWPVTDTMYSMETDWTIFPLTDALGRPTQAYLDFLEKSTGKFRIKRKR